MNNDNRLYAYFTFYALALPLQLFQAALRNKLTN